MNGFELKNVKVEVNETHSTEVHIYFYENELKPYDIEDLLSNGFTRKSAFHDFPIRGHEGLLHVCRCRWLDAENHNVMTECDPIQESTRCSDDDPEQMDKHTDTTSRDTIPRVSRH